MKLKKIALTLLSCLMLTACAGEPPELLSFIDENDNAVDYEGYQCYFLTTEAINGDPDESIFTYKINTLQGEALLKRIDDIKKDINVEIIFDLSYDETSYQIAAMSGGLKSDILSMYYMNAMQMLASGGFLHRIDDFPEYIDLNDTDKYGDANVREPVIINSIPYAVQPLLWPGFQSTDSFLLVSNTDMLATNNITNFHEFYENGTWTWDTFEKEFLDKFHAEKSDGIISSLSASYAELFDMMIYSNNVQYVYKNENGENVVNPFNEKFITAYDKMLEWVQKYPSLDTEKTWVMLDEFLNEDAAAVLAQGQTVTNGSIAYKDSTFAYNIMPFPCGPDAPYGKWANFVMSMKGIGITKASTEPNIAAHTISLLLEPFEDFGGRDGLYDFYKESIFLSETDAEIFFEIADKVRYDYTVWDQSDLGKEVAHSFGYAIRDGLSAAEAYDRYRNDLDKMVYDYILPNYDYMYENYYSKLED